MERRSQSDMGGGEAARGDMLIWTGRVVTVMLAVVAVARND